MIELTLQIQQAGGFIIMKYHAAEDSTSTEPEKQEVREIAALLQERIAKEGGKGTFVENNPDAADLPEFPDFGQPGEGGIAHGDDN